MEMHQVRYFLAAVDELNFTKAAEKCNVSQPSLTRAIKQLEGELGGDLFRRERPHAQLTELGERMLPLLKQCYDSAMGARTLASSMKSGEVGALRLALSRSISMELLTPFLAELTRVFKGLQLRLLRGTAAEVLELLKKGEAEFAVAADLGEEWERLDRWPLFTEGFELIVSRANQLAGRPALAAADLRQERLLRRTYCELAEQLGELLRSRQLDANYGHAITSERDLVTLVEADLGVAFVPRSLARPETLGRAPVEGLELNRTVYLYGVAGRQRTAVGSTIFKMLRAADWSRYAS
jgi:DNA-binding transcriptional LysR family regulator